MAQTILETMTAPDSSARPATVRLLFFGPVRARVGIDDHELKCADEMTTSTLWSLLAEQHPVLAPLQSTIRLARNGEFLRDDESIRPGDEIALIPPVSGG
jgi:molybdopterin synthase catalytic subunit